MLLSLVAQREATRALAPSAERAQALTWLRNQIKKELRRLKAEHKEELARRAEVLYRTGNHCGAWQEIKAMRSQGGASPAGPFKLITDSGETLLDPEPQAAELRGHFRSLYANGVGADAAAVAALPPAASQRHCPPLTQDEVELNLALLKNGKARDSSGLSNEQLKYAGPGFRAALATTTIQAWEEGLPASAKVFTMVAIPKQTAATQARNFRGIQVADKLNLLVARILASRLVPICEDGLLSDFQAGFRPGRSCRDQRFILQLLLEGAVEWRRPIYLAFVDLEKAFDRVDRAALLALLESYGVGEAHVRVAGDLHSDTTARLKWRGSLSEEFEILWGAQQGSPASNPLWNIVADIIGKQTLEELGLGAGVRIYSRSGRPTLNCPGTIPVDAEMTRLLLLMLADDMTVCAETPAELAHALQVLEGEVCLRWGMKINAAKTKLMRTGPGVDPVISLGGRQLEVVSQVKYLGSWFSNDGSLDREISARISH